MIQILIIPNWHPARNNQFIGRHWSIGAKLKKADAEMVDTYARHNALMTQARTKRRVRLELHGWVRGRLPDPDAFWKSLLDALVHAGLLRDDSSAWCEPIAPVFVRSAVRQTIIALEDI